MIRRVCITIAAAGACLASQSLAVDCTTVIGNRISPCGFESPAEVASWALQAADSAVFVAGLGENGGALQGDALLASSQIFTVRSPCFPAAPGEILNLGFAVQLVSGAAPSCTAGFQQWSNAGCTSGAGGAVGVNPVFPGVGYSTVADSHIVGAGTVAMSLFVDCRGPADFVVRIDNAVAAPPPLFSDGFETGLLTAWSSAGCDQGVIVNETDLDEEVDFCNLQFPSVLNLPPSTDSGAVFGRIFQAGLTEPPGAPAGVAAKVGFAPAGASPVHPANICLWQFQAATYNTQVGNDDEFGGSFTTPSASGSYVFTFLFSLDGTNWTACDLDGAGATPGFTFDLAQAGSLTVAP